MKYGFIGTGNMAGAIIKGMFDANMGAKIFGYDPNEKALYALAKEGKLIACTTPEEVVKDSDIIIMGVKPNVIFGVLDALMPAISEKKPLVISIAAGKKLSSLLEHLPESIRLARVMPNINARALCATTAYCTSSACTAMDDKAVEDIFSKIGSVMKLSEAELEIEMVLASSSPAFTYLYIDTLAQAALKAGMPKDKALRLAADSVLGSAKLILSEELHPSALADMVCSPGGTTIEGMAALKEFGFENSIHKAFEAALKKGVSLGETAPQKMGEIK